MHYKKNQLIEVNNSSFDNLTIDARQLHSQLQVSTQFKDWIRRRIQEFGFEEGKDFSSKLSEIKSGETRGRKSINYDLTLDMAKELAMLERNPVGQRIRRYFIAMEKEARVAYQSGKILPKRVHAKEVNGRRVYPFRNLAIALGYTTGGTLYYRRKKYPEHFIKLDKTAYCSEEMANLMAMSMSVRKHRKVIMGMQPILPANFAQTELPLMRNGGTKC